VLTLLDADLGADDTLVEAIVAQTEELRKK
jgi:hypothetical protein